MHRTIYLVFSLVVATAMIASTGLIRMQNAWATASIPCEGLVGPAGNLKTLETPGRDVCVSEKAPTPDHVPPNQNDEQEDEE